MAKGGRYSKGKTRNGNIFPLTIFLFVILACIAVFSGLNRSKDNSGKAAESETEDHTLSDHQTIPTNEDPSLPLETTIVIEDTLPTEAEMPTVIDDTLPTEMADTEAIETEPATENGQETQRNSKNTPEEIPGDYEEVLRQYREVLMMDSAEFGSLYEYEAELHMRLEIECLEDMVENDELELIAELLEHPVLSDRYPYVSGKTMRSAKTYGDLDLTVYHYAYYNIDDDRSPELLIGEYDDYHDKYVLRAIYTHTGTRVEELYAISDNGRIHMNIYMDGTILVDSSGSAYLHYWDFYQIDERSDMLTGIASFTINYHSSRSDIVAAAVEEYEASLTPVTDIIWNPLIKE